MAATPELDQREAAYLEAMVAHCQGDPSKQVSMYEVGAAVGMDRDTASNVCQELIAFGLVEIKTLSGGVGLTADGVAAGGLAAGGADAGSGPTLKKGPLVDGDDRQAVTTVLDELKGAAGAWGLGFDEMAALVIDIKTIETQLLAPRPKTAIVKAVCASLAELVKKHGDGASAAKIDALAAQ